MPKLSSVPHAILATRQIAQAHPDFVAALLKQMGDTTKSAVKNLHQYGSLALFTADTDDVGYIAADEATKHADAKVLYAGSFYAGAGNASMPLAGEFIAILGSPNPSDAAAALDAAITCYDHSVTFHYADDDEKTIFLAHTVANTGSYLSKMAGIQEGNPLAYLIAPPLEASLGLDAALKAADVRLAEYFPPPSPTNFSGGLLVGSLSDCREACEAFRDAVLDVTANPRKDG